MNYYILTYLDNGTLTTTTIKSESKEAIYAWCYNKKVNIIYLDETTKSFFEAHSSNMQIIDTMQEAYR